MAVSLFKELRGRKSFETTEISCSCSNLANFTVGKLCSAAFESYKQRLGILDMFHPLVKKLYFSLKCLQFLILYCCEKWISFRSFLLRTCCVTWSVSCIAHKTRALVMFYVFCAESMVIAWQFIYKCILIFLNFFKKSYKYNKNKISNKH